jgi:hypothetical protein
MTTERASYQLDLEGTADPTAGAGVAAPTGTVYRRITNGAVYVKVGVANTAWSALWTLAGSPVQLASARCDPNPPTDVTISFQTGQFQNPSTYVGVGIYTIQLNVIPGLVAASQVLWTATAFTAGRLVTLQPGFSAGAATVGARVVMAATGVAVEDTFFLNGVIIGL